MKLAHTLGVVFLLIATTVAQAGRPVARWDVVAYQRIDAPFKVGLVAFHPDGVKVEFAVNGTLVHTADNPTLNDRVNVWEYWFTFDPSQYADGPVTIDAKSISLNGTDPDYDIEPLTLYANSGGSLTVDDVRWVDATNGSDSNPGTEALPYATLNMAVDSVTVGGTVYLKAGTYDCDGINAGLTRDYWTTVAAAPGLGWDDVEISTGRPKTEKLKLQNLSIFTDSTSGSYTAILNGENGATVIWLDNVKAWNKNGRYAASTFILGNSYHSYTTGGMTTMTREGPRGALVRDHQVIEIGSDVFTGAKRLVVNCIADGTDPGTTGWHPDFHQSYSVAPEWTEDFIMYNVKAYNQNCQGFFGSRLRNSAFVNVLLERVPDVNYLSQYSGPMENNMWSHITHVNQTFNWRGVGDNALAAVDMHLNNSVFVQMSLVEDATDTGMTIDTNHFSGNSLGTNVTTGSPEYVDADANNYRLLNSSPAYATGYPMQCIPADVDGVIYDTTNPNRGAFAASNAGDPVGSGPTADAGPDQTIADTGNDGSESVTLDGSGSTDADGNIVSWEWTDGGYTLATGEIGVTTLAVGQHTITLMVTDNDGLTDADTVVVTIEAIPLQAVEAVFVFYNNSAFVGDNAIDLSKTPLLFGQSASFANYTGYDKGLNGVMFDLTSISGSISVTDFDFKVGNDSTPEAWAAAPAPASVILRSGEGTSGCDRVEIVWADGAIKNQWLEITVKANDNTGVPANEVFYFGNAVGETGNSVSDAIVDSTDEVACRNNPRNFMRPAAVDCAYDINKDKKVDATDQIICRNNVTDFSNDLELIDLGVVSGDVTADAGADANWLDREGDGDQDVVLDGMASSATVGTITSYLWEEGDTTLSTDALCRVNLTTGVHTISLTVTTDGGATDTDTVIVTVDELVGPMQKLSLGGSSTDRFTKLYDLVWPINPGEPDICVWEDDKFAAVSLTIDDNIVPDHQWWIDICNQYDWKVTWFVVVGGVVSGSNPSMNGTWDNWNTLQALGHGVESHSWSHHSDDDVRPESEVIIEYRNSQQALRDNVTGNKSSFFGWPYGRSNRDIAKIYAAGGRGTTGTPNKAERINYLDTGSASGRVDSDYLHPILDGTSGISWLNNTNYMRGWLSVHYHMVNDKPAVEADFAYMASRNDELWVGLWGDVAKYGQERDSATMTTLANTSTQIAFSISDEMDDTVFDYPLTVKVKLYPGWVDTTATQNGQPTEMTIVEHDGSDYALVKVVPDRGTVVIAPTSLGNFDPIANAGLNQTVVDGDEDGYADVTLDGSGSVDTDGSIASYAWDVGGTPIGTGVSPTVSLAVGVHTITLTVTDNEGATDTDTVEVTVAVPASGQTYVINGHNDDQERRSDGTSSWVGQADHRVGGATGTGDSASIYVFALPELDPGEAIVTANLDYDYNKLANSPGGQVDLYGLGYRTASTVVDGDFFQGAYGTDTTDAWPLQDDIMDKSTPIGLISSDDDGDAALAAYIQAQYDSGAQAGDFIFLRLSPDADSVSNYHYWQVTSANGSVKPVLTIETGPAQ